MHFAKYSFFCGRKFHKSFLLMKKGNLQWVLLNSTIFNWWVHHSSWWLTLRCWLRKTCSKVKISLFRFPPSLALCILLQPGRHGINVSANCQQIGDVAHPTWKNYRSSTDSTAEFITNLSTHQSSDDSSTRLKSDSFSTETHLSPSVQPSVSQQSPAPRPHYHQQSGSCCGMSTACQGHQSRHHLVHAPQAN